jgi:uncharacterized membrane protein
MTGTLGWLALAMVAFVGGHFLLSSPAVRGPLVARLGEGPFLGLYSGVAIAFFVWFLFAYGAAPYVELWPAPTWARSLPVIVMPLATLLAVCGYGQPNPTAVMQAIAPAGSDPAPGVLKITRHPIMWSMGLWALAHIPPNGDAASLILFGGLAALALGGTLAIDAKRRARDPEGFGRLAAATSNVPFAAMLSGRARLRYVDIGWWRLLVATLLYFALVLAHPFIAGVALF